MLFNHENLQVYQRTLSFNVKANVWTDQWDSRHAICDHLVRAAGSMLENIAMASAAHSAMKLRSLDYAVGSSLECAACIDIAGIKQMLNAETGRGEKEELCQIMRMLVGLRKHWSQATQAVHEEMAAYPAQDERIDRTCGKDGRTMPLFHHEALDVYRVALEATAAFCCSAAVSCLSNTSFRRLDELVTSMVLNIAEGNGRFSRADQARFLSTAYESAVKLAARLDLCVIQTLLPPDEVARCKMLLQRVSFMTVSMIADVQG